MSEIMQAPRYYRIDDRMLGPRFFSGQKPEAPIDDHRKLCGQTILDDDAPPTGTVMRLRGTVSTERSTRPARSSS